VIRFETHVGKEIGTLRRGPSGVLVCSSSAVEDIVSSKQRAYGWDDAKTYEWFRSGALDNGYIKATEVVAA
jgi:hypothetical protein